ncbi:hypothetical protein [Olleya sp. YS]|uniref:hypothetical protein n=1 Tax=Olleya sp. YS TaxID=3028318 RepID=UPI002434359B|nr:hypothetical protein [Olleya sp. YS]WGD34286.1 hypothetical protein Ollyesu_10915 [Olleya sp. YS]
MNSNKIKDLIVELSEAIYTTIIKEKLHLKIDSTGIENGKEIVNEFVEQNEIYLAFEHVEYMISETEIKLKEDELKKLNDISSILELKEQNYNLNKLKTPFIIYVIIFIVGVCFNRFGSKKPTPQTVSFFASIYGLVFAFFYAIKLYKFKKSYNK